MPTSTTIAELERILEARYGPFQKGLELSLDAWPGREMGPRTLLLPEQAGRVSGLDRERTLATCGVWGRRHRRREDAETDDHPVLRFLYCAFTPGPYDPLLQYDAGP